MLSLFVFVFLFFFFDFCFQFLFGFWFVLFLGGSLVFVVCGLLFLFSSTVVCCRIPIHRVQVSDPFYENYYLLTSLLVNALYMLVCAVTSFINSIEKGRKGNECSC